MKYYKTPGGTFGTYDDSGTVPYPTASKSEYDLYVASLPVYVPKKDLKDVLLEKGIITQLAYDEVK